MRYFAFSCLLLAVAVSSPAQIASPIILPPGQPLPPAYSDLVSFLNLTSTQLQSLEQIQQQKNQAVQEIYKQVSEKQTQLSTLLASSSPDPLQVGQLMIEIRALQQQASQQAGKSYRQPALAVLMPDQATKLQTLVNALQLQVTANQAVTLNLIDAVMHVFPLPLPVVTPFPAQQIPER